MYCFDLRRCKIKGAWIFMQGILYFLFFRLEEFKDLSIMPNWPPTIWERREDVIVFRKPVMELTLPSKTLEIRDMSEAACKAYTSQYAQVLLDAIARTMDLKTCIRENGGTGGNKKTLSWGGWAYDLHSPICNCWMTNNHWDGTKCNFHFNQRVKEKCLVRLLL